MPRQFNDVMDTDETIKKMVNEEGCVPTMDYCFERGMKKLFKVKLNNDYKSAQDAAWYFNKWAEIYQEHQKHI